ncbi:uncharacterized protein LOC142519235 [Primulina tabacum]|uniref:uncharacterized protein LOC142519235 n=1 Tax=Primulina tabacum TaxID=48773 RepID=UPI003F5A75FC
MCCGSRVCCFCMCVILMVIAVGFLFGFGVFKHGFRKLKDSVHDVNESVAFRGRPLLGFGAPPPF